MLDLSNLGLTTGQFAELLPAIYPLATLASLNLSQNQLTTLPETVGELTALTSLNLSNNNLTTLPEAVGNLTALTTLNLSTNKLAKLPEAVGKLTALTSLELSHNRLTTLPEEVGNLTALTSLSLFENELTILPAGVGNLTALTSLSLYNNQLTTLPESFGNLTALTSLDLSSNDLKTLPDSVCKFTALIGLCLSLNELAALPDGIGNLNALTVLYLENNKLAALPEGLRKLTGLLYLFLHDNEALGLPSEVLGSSWDTRGILDVQSLTVPEAASKPTDILDYYFKTLRGARTLREVKLILIGWGDVGKSTVADALQGKPFKKTRKPTEGIQISRWPVRAKGGEAFVRIWDFGGQEIMHGTHQFFLTKRAIYVVIVKGRDGRGQRDAEYWLKHARAFGGESTVLLVMNRQDECAFDLDRSALATKHGVPLNQFFLTECSDAKTIRPLAKKITEIVSTLLDKHANFPASWWPVKKALEGMEDDYLSDANYRAVCIEHEITDAGEQDQILDRLNDLGVVVHFPDDALADLKVLDPEWATDGVYRVINNEKLREEKHGKLRMSELKDILPKDRWPEAAHRRYVIELMRRFDLCFPAEGEDGVYIVADLLPDKTPRLAAWDATTCVVFRYKYPVLPHGILPRFISKTHKMSEGKERWRSGVVVAEDGAESLVRADYEENVVDIWVRGGHKDARRSLLTIIRKKFEEINGRFKELNPEEKIAAPGHPSALIPYRDLILDKRRGKADIAVTIDGERQDVSISDVLEGMASSEEHEAAANRFETFAERQTYSEKPMSIHVDKSINISGNVSNAQVGQTLTNCNNIVRQRVAGKTKDAMEALRREVGTLIPHLPQDKHEQVAENLEMALKQAAKDKPDRKWYSVSAEGLMEAATWAKDFSGNIAGTVGNLGKCLWPDFTLPSSAK